MDTDIHPVIIEDFPLEKLTRDMSLIEKEAFLKGFSKCFTSLISAINANEKILFPNQKAHHFEHISDLMISSISSSSNHPSSIA